VTLPAALRTVFLVEAWLVNGGVAVLCFFFPAVFLTQYASGVPPAGVEIVRWYGVLLSVLAVVMLRALAARDDRVLKPAVEGLLFGDLAHLGACGFYFVAVPVVSFPFVLMVVSSVLLAGVRVAWLVVDYRDRHADPNWKI